MVTHLVRAGFIMSGLDPNMKYPSTVSKQEGGYSTGNKIGKSPTPRVQKSYPTPEDPPPGRGPKPSDWTE